MYLYITKFASENLHSIFKQWSPLPKYAHTTTGLLNLTLDPNITTLGQCNAGSLSSAK